MMRALFAVSVGTAKNIISEIHCTKLKTLTDRL